MKVLRFVPCLTLLVALCATSGAAGVAAQETPRVSVSVVELTGTIDDGPALATLKISVNNQEESDMTGFSVTFDDDSSVSVGDVAAGKSAVSASVTKVIDTTGMFSRNSPIKVTLKFTFAGNAVEMPYDLLLSRR